MELGQVINKLIKGTQSLYIHYGVVSQVTTSPNRVSVRISGATTAITGIRYLASYTPTVSDIVICLFNDSDVIVLGELV